MAKPIAIAILANGNQAGRTFDSLGSKAAKWGKAVTAAGAIAAIALAKTVVDAASQAQQSIGATEQIYGKYAATVIKRSNEAADAVGLSANEYRELANVTGAMLKTAGMPLAKVTELTDKLNRRAADMAATFGGTTRQALEAVSSLLRGEADPIEQYGVSIKQSDVNARLAAKGLDKLTGSAKKTAEQQARLDLLFTQSKDSAGQFSRESNTLAGQQQRLAAKIENTKVRIGTALLPMATKLAVYANRELVPVLEKAAQWLETNSDEIAAFGKGIGRQALPPLKALVGIVGDVVQWMSDLPAPVKDVAVQAGIAALVLPRLAAGAAAAGAAFTGASAKTKQFVAELTYLETRQQRAAAGLSRLSGAARTAAGVGGMVALTEGAQKADTAAGALMTTAGMAATGFAVGGPWGAAAGTVGGVAVSLWNAKKASDEAKDATTGLTQAQYDAMQPVLDYKDSLDQATGALTRLTKERVRDDLIAKGTLATAQTYGISTRDLTLAAIGREGAERRLSKQVQQAIREHPENTAGILSVAGAVGIHADQVAKDQKAVRQAAEDNKTWKRALEGIPREARSEIKQVGGESAIRQVNKLIRRYDLTPKQVATVLKATGTEGVVKKVNGVTKVMQDAGKAKVIDNFNPSLSGLLGVGERSAKRGKGKIQDSLKQVGAVAPNLRAFLAGLTGSIDTGRSTARSGSAAMGVDLKTGLPVGFAGADALWGGQVAAAVRAAINAGRQEADAHSPSRETARLGQDLADGLPVGMARRSAKVKQAGRDLVAAALAGVTDGSKGVSNAYSKVTKLVEKLITGKNQDKREKAVLKSMRDEFKQLERNGKLQDKINAKLAKRQQILSDLVRAAKDHVAAITASVLAYGGITALEEGHLNSPSSLTAQMEARVKNAERFATLIQQLTGKLNNTSLQELIDKGVDGGLATAEALAAGGQATIDQVNALQDRLNAVGANLGATATAQFHQVGIDAAQGFVDGLLKQSAKLDKAAKKLARLLVKAIKDELGIKSLSRVGKALGSNFASSIDLGTNVVPLHNTGRLMARDLVKGFGEPTMTARAVWDATRTAAAAPQQTVVVEVRITAEQLSLLEQGRRITIAQTAYQRAGGLSA